MKECCVLDETILMSTHSILLSVSKRKSPEIIQNRIMFAARRFFVLRTQERVRNSRGKRAISVRSTEVLLYFIFLLSQNGVHTTDTLPYVHVHSREIETLHFFNGIYMGYCLKY